MNVHYFQSPRRATYQNRQMTPFQRFSDGLRGLRDFNQQGFSREVVDQDIEARWYMLTLEQRETFEEDWAERQVSLRVEDGHLDIQTSGHPSI